MVLDRESQLELVFVCPLYSIHEKAANDFFDHWKLHFQNQNFHVQLADNPFLSEVDSFKRNASFLKKTLQKKKESYPQLLQYPQESILFFLIGEDPMLITWEGLILDFDFEKSSLHFRHQVQKKSDLLLKASGLLERQQASIADLTAGTLADSFLMARFGARVQAWERSVFLFPLLEQALIKEQHRQKLWPEKEQFAKNISLKFADAKELLQQRELLASFDTLVFDPMFPETKKNALPRKEMQIFRQLVGEDADAEQLVTFFGKALTSQQRLIVKRPLEAPPIVWNTHEGRQAGPRRSVQGNLVRWDIYLGT